MFLFSMKKTIHPIGIFHRKQAIIRIVSAMPKANCDRQCVVEGNRTVTLSWLIEDYVDHMEHHLLQIIPA